MATVTAASTATSDRDGALAGPPDATLAARFGRLRLWNIGVGIVLAVQAVLIAVLTNGFSLPVTATFMSGPPGTPARLHHLFDVPIGWGVFAFLAISAGGAAHHRLAARVRLVHGATCCRTATTAAGSSTSSARRS